MNKIPVKIIEFSDGDQLIQEVMIDLSDTMELKGNPEEHLEKFKKQYFELVEKAQKLMPKKREEKIPSVYWKIANLFKKFNDSTTNKFKITNYSEALERDFGLSSTYVHELIIFVNLFKKMK